MRLIGKISIVDYIQIIFDANKSIKTEIIMKSYWFISIANHKSVFLYRIASIEMQ